MLKSPLFWIALVVLLATAAATNPNEAAHKTAVTSRLRTSMQMALADGDMRDDAGLVFQMIGILRDRSTLREVADEMTSVDDYFFFSVTKAAVDGGVRTAGFGIFGKVHLADWVDEYARAGLLDSRL